MYRSFVAILAVSVTGAVWAGNFGCGAPHAPKSHCGCKCKQDSCETIVIHCCPPEEKSPRLGRFSRDEAAPVYQPSRLVSPSYGMMQPGFAMSMPMVPMMGGVMQVSSFQRPRANDESSEGRSDSRLEARVDRLEKDVQEMADQLDEVVNSVDRNSRALEALIEKLTKSKAIKLPPIE